MIYLFSIGSMIAIFGGLAAAWAIASKFSTNGLKGGLIYSASAIVTILLLQIVSLIFGSSSFENGGNQFAVFDTFAFLACLFMLCFSYFGLRSKEKRA